MSAPAGWHLQPDGQERYWDGTRWTDEFREPLPSDPTAPPPLPTWAGSADETQAMDVSSTQALPRTDPAPYPPQQVASAPQDAAYPPAGAPLPPGGYQQTGYGTPGAQPYPPPRQGGNGLLKGCLIAAVAIVVVVGIAIAAGFFFFARTVDQVSESFPSTFPTELPSDFPSDLPTGVPTEGLGEAIELSVGDGFELPRATIAAGWSLDQQGTGIPIVNVSGMKATVQDDNGFPVLFTMSVTPDGGDAVETVCTAPSGSAGATVDVTCVPLFGDVADATRVTVTASL